MGRAREALADSDSMGEDARGELEGLLEDLQGLLQHYEETLIGHGLELPYPQPGA